MPLKTPSVEHYDDDRYVPLRDLLDDWVRSLKAANTAEATLKSYREVATEFCDFLDCEPGVPKAPEGLKRTHVDAYLAHLQRRPARTTTGRLSASTVAKQYRSLMQLFRWLVEVEEVLPVSPMARMSPPQVEKKTVPVITQEHLSALFATCSTNAFKDRRDLLLMHMLFDTGVRNGELTGMLLSDVLQDRGQIVVRGKGNKARNVTFGNTTGVMLRRYLRSRSQHRDRHDEGLWLGRMGRLTESGIADAIEQRCIQAGIPHVNPHRFRHTFAHLFLLNGGQEGDLMHLAGWASREMVNRYGASAKAERAHEAHRANNVADQLAAKRESKVARRGRKPGG